MSKGETMTNQDQMIDALLREIAGEARDASSISSIIAGLDGVDAAITRTIGQLMRDGDDEQAARLRDNAESLGDALEVLGSLYTQMEGRGF